LNETNQLKSLGGINTKRQNQCAVAHQKWQSGGVGWGWGGNNFHYMHCSQGKPQFRGFINLVQYAADQKITALIVATNFCVIQKSHMHQVLVLWLKTDR